MALSLRYHDATARAVKAKVERALSAANQAAPVRKAALIWRNRMIRRTPKRWTGQTRRSWQVQQLRANIFLLTNTSKVMVWLERGTRAHGPRHAKRLFVPLTRKAMLAGPRVVMEANRAAREASKWQNYGAAAAGSKKKKVKYPYVYGKDFVFARRVKGIRPIWIVRSARPEAERTLRLLMTEHILAAITSA